MLWPRTNSKKTFPRDLFRATIIVFVYKISMTWYSLKRHAARADMQALANWFNRFFKTLLKNSDTHNAKFYFEEILWREEITTSRSEKKIKGAFSKWLENWKTRQFFGLFYQQNNGHMMDDDPTLPIDFDQT